MPMDSLQKSFLPMWQEETLAKVSRKLDIIDENDEQKVGQAEQLCYQTGGLCTRQEDAARRDRRQAVSGPNRTHELGQLLGHANFFRGIHTAAIVLREACCFFVCLVEGFRETVASSLCSSCEVTTVNSCKHFFQIWG